MFHAVSVACSMITAIYGVGILMNPNFFMGGYIYRRGLWKAFMDNNDSGENMNIVNHLIQGIALTWISWSLGYAATSTIQEPIVQRTFALFNFVIWLAWCVLDSKTRRNELYSSTASTANRILTLSITFVWAYIFVF